MPEPGTQEQPKPTILTEDLTPEQIKYHKANLQRIKEQTAIAKAQEAAGEVPDEIEEEDEV
jgi:hypothetical protein